MTQQIINLGTGPDSYTGDTVRDAFLKVNENFTELYSGNISGNVTANSITASGNVTANYFLGNGAFLTGITAGSGNYGDSNVAAYLPTYTGNIRANIVESVTSVRVGNVSAPSVALFASQDNVAYLTSSTSLRPSGANVNLVLTSTPNNYIILNANTNRMGFKTTTTLSHDFNFNGVVRANSFISDVNTQQGYMFNTNTGLTGMSHTNEGNVSLVKISHDNNPVARFYDSNSTVLLGHLEIRHEEADATTFPNPFVLASTNVNSYSQLVLQNFSNGYQASSDIVLTADNGNDSAYFGDFGIASSTYFYPGYGIIKPNDVYLLAVSNDLAGPGSNDSGNLIVGTTNGNIKMFVGAPEDANVIATISTTGINVSRGNITLAQSNPPTAANSTGTTGQIAWDNGYVYVCVAANTWKRANLSTW